MKYELSDEQIKQLLSILSNLTVKVCEANIIFKLIETLQKPIKTESKSK